MTDWDVVRTTLNEYVEWAQRLNAEHALDRIEADVAGLKVELEDASQSLAYLRQENERLREAMKRIVAGWDEWVEHGNARFNAANIARTALDSQEVKG